MRGAVAKERQEVQRLRKHGQRLMRQVQSLDQQLRAEQDAKGIKLLKRMWRDRYGVERLVNEVRTGALKRKWWQAMRGTLLQYYPREQQLQELKGSLAKERRKVRRLEKQSQRLKLRMQTLNQQARTSESLQQRERRPPSVDQVDFGSLRQVNPISREFGYDRGKPVDRYYIENFLAARAGDIRGRVLEVKDDTYTRKYGGEQVDVSDVIDMAEDNRQATIVADLTRADRVPSDAFDCIIFTQTLQLIYDMRSAIQTLHRVLKPGGVLLATFPGISQISYKDCGDSWCWEFTQLSVRRLFEESFSGADISIEAHGNVLAAIAFLHGLAAEELRREELDYRDPDYEVLITLRAVKQQAQT
jgi:SAM-dependent methyltransferase